MKTIFYTSLSLFVLLVLPLTSFSQVSGSVDAVWKFDTSGVFRGYNNDIICYGCVYVAGRAGYLLRNDSIPYRTGTTGACSGVNDYYLTSGNWPNTFDFNKGYYEFTYNVMASDSGACYVNFEGIMFDYTRNATGPTKLAVYYALEGSPFQLLNCDFNVSRDSCERFIDAVRIDGVEKGTFRLRIYGFGATNSTGEFCVDNVRILATLTCTQPCNPDQGVPLPVRVESFEGRQLANAIHLDWVAEQSIHNSHFAIERLDPLSPLKSNGAEFRELGIIGDRDGLLTDGRYSFTDPSPQIGVNYYRLRQVDLDGTTTYHGPIQVQFRGVRRLENLEVFPNPTYDETLLRWTGTATRLQLLDKAGRVLADYVLQEGINQHPVDLSAYPSGIYMLRLAGDEEVRVLPLTKH